MELEHIILARKGIEFEVKPKKISVYNLKIINHNSKKIKHPF